MDAAARAAIEQDCIRLSNAFAYHLDHGDYEALADLFHPDGVWERLGVELRGRAAIVEALRARPANQFTRHVTTGHHFIEIGETVARSHAYNMSYGSMDAGSLPATLDMNLAMLLDFIDNYVKTPEGWRFSRRITTVVLLSDTVRAIFAAQSQ